MLGDERTAKESAVNTVIAQTDALSQLKANHEVRCVFMYGWRQYWLQVAEQRLAELQSQLGSVSMERNQLQVCLFKSTHMSWITHMTKRMLFYMRLGTYTHVSVSHTLIWILWYKRLNCIPVYRIKCYSNKRIRNISYSNIKTIRRIIFGQCLVDIAHTKFT